MPHRKWKIGSLMHDRRTKEVGRVTAIYPTFLCVRFDGSDKFSRVAYEHVGCGRNGRPKPRKPPTVPKGFTAEQVEDMASKYGLTFRQVCEALG